MIKNIIFDFGNVLVDWNPHYLYDSYFDDPQKCEYYLKWVCNRAWYTVSDAGIPMQDAIAMQSRRFPEFAEALEIFLTRFMDMISGEIPGMKDLILELKAKGYKVYGLTNWSKETFEIVEKEMDIFSLLDGKVISSEEFMVKPFPDIYKRLLDKFELKAEECVFIDDNPINAIGADMVGIKGICFKNPEQLRGELSAIL